MNTFLTPLRLAAAALAIVFGHAGTAWAQVSIGVAVPGVSIGIDLPIYPSFERVPNQPVYYAPRQSLNLFFYDGLYWVYQRDNWYASSWYGGPWQPVGPQAVPAYVLRVPVRYYRNPPSYFNGWRADAPPRWGEHWGGDWSRQRDGWQHWNRRDAPAPAPLPIYQRRYSGDRYPGAEQQRDLHDRNYRYRPRDEDARRYIAPAPGRGDDMGHRNDRGNHRGQNNGNANPRGRDHDPREPDPDNPSRGRGQGR